MISIDSSLLTNYYLSKEGILASSSSTSASASSASSSSATTAAAPTPPWDAPTPKNQTASAASALATQVLNGQNIIDPNTTLTSVKGASGTYDNLFTLYQGLNALEGMTEQMLASSATTTGNANIASAFDSGLSQVSSYVNGLDLPNLRISTGNVSSNDTSTEGPATENDNYNTPVIFVGSQTTPVPSFQGTVQFNINIAGQNGKNTTVPIDLSGMGSTARTMPNVTNYINSQLQAAGVLTRFADNETPGQPQTIQVGGQSVTLPAGPDQWGWTIQGISTEQVSFSAPSTAAAVYVAQTAGNVSGYAAQEAADASSTSLDAEEGITPPASSTSSSTNSSSTSSTSSTSSSTTSSTDTISQPFQQLLTFQNSTASTTATAPSAATSLPGTTNAVAGEISAQTLDPNMTSVQATATGADGSLYVLGDVDGTVDNQTIQGSQDAVLQKFDSAGNLVYTQTLGAANSASGYSMAVSADGQVAIAGSFTGDLDAGDLGNGATGTDSFVTLYDSSGDEAWTQTGLQPSNNQVNSVAFGANDEVLVAGQSNISTTASPAYGPTQGFIAGYSASGDQLFSTNTGTANAQSLAVDGNTVVVAGTSSAGDAVVNSYALQTTGAPTLTATRDLGSLGNGAIAGVAINNGQVVVAGTTSNGALNAGTVTSASSGGQEAFVAQLSEDLAPASTDQIAYFGGAKGTKTTATALTISGGQVYIAGSSNTALPGMSSVGSQDGYVASVDIGSGTIGWSERFSGQDGYAAPESIAVASSGASILNKLGLPTQTIQQTSSQLLTSATSVRAGDTFQVRTRQGGTPVTVTIDATDTPQTLASKIVAATGYTANVTTETLNGGLQVEIKPDNPDSTIELLPGPAGSNALTALGLNAGVVQTASALSSSTKKNTNSGIAANTYGLNIDGGFNLTTTAGIQAAQKSLQTAAALVQTAFYTLANGNKPASAKPQITGTVPAYLQAQLANYQSGLARLESSSSSSSSSATSADSSSQVALSLLA